MLYLESPAGSGQGHGFSTCIKGGKPVACSWDDVNQGEVYAHTLAAFYKAFPEYSENALYLTGESYFGQSGPNIANWILTHAPFNASLPLKGIALGNACWGGDANTVQCNGPNSDQNDVDMFYGKGLISKKLYQEVYKTCDFPLKGGLHLECDAVIEKAFMAVGPHNVYNIYDNCAGAALPASLAKSGRSMRWLTKQLRAPLSSPEAVDGQVEAVSPSESSRRALAEGGYDWSCGGMDATQKWIVRADVRKALHLTTAGQSAFHYKTSGPASITLYPFLMQKLRILIYNGDADACVPYKGNEEWITSLVDAGDLSEKSAWKPWYTNKSLLHLSAPAGYVTSYTVEKGTPYDFSFLTIRLAGHMVPTFQPSAALAFFERFLSAEPF